MEGDLEKEFFEFIYERQLIWYKRFVLKENFPWTDDEILCKYKFINMYRELDRVTVYILKKLQNAKSREALFTNIVFCRFFNRDNLYEELGAEPFERMSDEVFENTKFIFDSRSKEGKRIFNNAYLISSRGREEKKYVEVLKAIKGIDFNDLTKEIDKSRTPEESLEVIMKIPLVGPFLACEIWTDLSYFGFFNQGWNDDDFVNIGPGAKWGLEIIYGKLSRKELYKKLRHLYLAQNKFLDNPEWEKIAYRGASSNYPFLSITNIEGALCEFRKYWNIKHGKGRRKYYRQNNF